MRPLTDRQAKVFAVICRGWISGRAPTLREIGEQLEIGSTNGVHDHLVALERRDLVVRPSVKAPLVITPRGWKVWTARELGVPDLDAESATLVAYSFAARVSLGAPLDGLIAEFGCDEQTERTGPLAGAAHHAGS